MAHNNTVRDYNTGNFLAGIPSSELEAASEAASPTGAVLAYRDKNGVWQYVPSCDSDHYQRHLKHHVRTVYID